MNLVVHTHQYHVGLLSIFKLHGVYHIPDTYGRLYETWRWPASPMVPGDKAHALLCSILPAFVEAIDLKTEEILSRERTPACVEGGTPTRSPAAARDIPAEQIRAIERCSKTSTATTITEAKKVSIRQGQTVNYNFSKEDKSLLVCTCHLNVHLSFVASPRQTNS